MVASIYASQQPAFRGGGGPPGPTLLSGYSFRLNANDPTTYPGGTLPANGASLSTTLRDSVSGTLANKTSTGTATFVANAANSKGGIRFAGSTAYTILNAALPPNFFNQTPLGNFTQHFAFTGIGAGGNSACSLSWAGANANIILDIRATTGAANGCGAVISGGNTLRMTMQDTGTHVLTLVSDITKIGTQPGVGRTFVYMDGLPIAVVGDYTATAATDVCFGALNAAGGVSSMNGTLLDYVFYPTTLTPLQIWNNTEYFYTNYGKTLPTKVFLVAGSSLIMGTGGSQGFNVTESALAQLSLTAATSIGNFGIGGAKWPALDTVATTEIDPYITKFGAANVALACAEGYNDLIGSTAAASVARAVTYLRNRIAAGFLPQNIWIYTITGVATTRAQFAESPAYVALIKAIPATYLDLALVNIIAIDTDPNLGVAPTAAIDGGYYGTTAAGSNGLGANPDGYNGATSNDGVHRTGLAGWLPGGTGVISGYPMWAERWLSPIADAFLP